MRKRGLTLVNAMHITASGFINDDESGLHHDYKMWLEELAPHTHRSTRPARRPVAQPHWRGLSRGNRANNADAHLKRQVMSVEEYERLLKRQQQGDWKELVHGARARIQAELVLLPHFTKWPFWRIMVATPNRWRADDHRRTE
jgi:thiamine phosphate synthase YjbQ (UPF0047 family)